MMRNLVSGDWVPHHRTDGAEDSLNNLVAMYAICYKNIETYSIHLKSLYS
jgi:hypothetical protein